MARDEGALEAVREERRPGRPMSTRQNMLEALVVQENKEWETGLWMPDLRVLDTVEKLVAWKGEWSGLAYMKFVRAAKDGVVRVSAFPPTGAA